MYEAFDRFLATDTWASGHDSDRKRFFEVLRTVIAQPTFNPDNLGNYMRSAKGVDRNDEDNTFNLTIDGFVSDAWAVYDYLHMTDQQP